jgi:hypothetical protein
VGVAAPLELEDELEDELDEELEELLEPPDELLETALALLPPEEDELPVSVSPPAHAARMIQTALTIKAGHSLI